MSMQRSDSIHALGSVSAAGAATGPPANEGARRWTVAAPAMSVYTITLDEPIDVTERCVQVTVTGVLDSIATVSGGTDTTIVVSTGVASTGAAGDRAFDFVVFRVAG